MSPSPGLALAPNYYYVVLTSPAQPQSTQASIRVTCRRKFSHALSEAAPRPHRIPSAPSHLRRGASSGRGRSDSLPSKPSYRQGEADLPRAPLPPSAPVPPLPATTDKHAVLLQDRRGAVRTLLSMRRMPFWLVDADGMKHAVVMYIAE